MRRVYKIQVNEKVYRVYSSKKRSAIIRAIIRYLRERDLRSKSIVLQVIA